MIFMSQSALVARERESDWDRWYIEHLRIMATVPGISSAQRFKTEASDYPRSLAMYSIASADVFTDPYYQSIRGMGEWAGLIDRRFYQRNLFDGLDRAPTIGDSQVLLVADRDAPDDVAGEAPWTWLECVGIDQTTPYRGIAVIDAAAADRLASSRNLAVYSPVTLAVTGA